MTFRVKHFRVPLQDFWTAVHQKNSTVNSEEFMVGNVMVHFLVSESWCCGVLPFTPL